MKDARDKNNDKSLAPKSDPGKDSGQSQVDSPVPAKQSDKPTAKAHASDTRPVLTSNPIAQVFEQVTKAVDTVQKNAGDITNAALNTVIHNDLGKQFADNVSPELASEYQKGKKLVEARISKGLDPNDLSGLNAAQKKQVEAYNKIHAELPGKIPFYNQEALSRQIDLALSQKSKTVPPPPVAPGKTTLPAVNRHSSNAPANQIPQSAAKDVSRPQSRVPEVKAEMRSTASKITDKVSEVKNIDSRVPGQKFADKGIEPKTNDKPGISNVALTTPEADRAPKSGAITRGKQDGPLDTSERHVESKSTYTTFSRELASAPPKARSLAPDRTPESKSAALQSANKGPQILVAKDAVKSDSPPAAPAKLESRGTSTRATVIVHHSDKTSKTDAIASPDMAQKPHLARIKDPIAEVLGQGKYADNKSAGRAIEATSKRTANYIKNVDLSLEIGKYRTFTIIAKDKLIPLNRSLERQATASRVLLLPPSGERSQFIWTSPRLHHAPSEMVSTSSAKHEAAILEVSPKAFIARGPVIAQVTSETFTDPQHSHSSDIGTASGDIERSNHGDVVKSKSNSQPPLSAEILAPDSPKDATMIGANTLKSSLSGGAPAATDRTPRVVRDLKYITGAELVFAVIVAVAGTARARSHEPLMQSVRLESVITDVADSEVVACGEDLTQLVSDRLGPTLAARPQILVALDDTLTQIAARLYGDPAIAWLIAALNPQCQFYYHKERCLVRLKVRQSLVLPVFEDLKTFARWRKGYMVADNILTVVEDTAVNKEVLSNTFAGLLGLDSLSVDPLQKIKRAQS